MSVCRPAVRQHSAGQVGSSRQPFHVFNGGLPQQFQLRACLVGLVERLIAAQRLLDLLVIWEVAAVGCTELARSLALGTAVVELPSSASMRAAACAMRRRMS